jgi:quercetin dioxygenase-like cupin family protein
MKRVVNGWDESGNATILFEGEPPIQFDFGEATSAEIWRTNSVPAEFQGRGDTTSGEFQVEPPLGGSICRIASYRPGARVDSHSTETVDYVVVLAGELTMIFGDREIVLRPQDVVVQQATPHGWANNGAEICVVAVVLLTAEGASEEGRLHWP